MRSYALFLVLVVNVGLAGCGPMVVWKGHTPDRGTRVRILEDGSEQFLRVGDSAGPRFDGIAREGLVFSPDGRRIAYPARKGEKWTVVADGEPGPWWDGVGEVRFSPDGEGLAYSALKDDQWCVIQDGNPGPWFDDLFQGTLSFDPVSGRLSYVGGRGDSSYLVSGAELGSPFDEVSAPLFLPDGSGVAFAARRGKSEHVVVKGVVGSAWEAVAGLVLHPVSGEPAFFGKEDGQWFALLGENRLGPFDAADGLVFSASGDAWAFMGRRDGVDRIVKSDGEGPGHRHILPGSLRLSPSGGAVAYVVGEQGAERAVVSSRSSAPYTEVRAVDFSSTGAHVVYIGVDSLGERVVLDGVPGPVFERISDLQFAEDGKTLGYVARDGEGGVVVIGVDRYRFPVVAEGSLVLDPRARHWAVIAGSPRARALHFFVDGVDTSREFDWEELVDAQRLGAGGLPDLRQSDAAVKAWVRAEMELFLARVPAAATRPQTQ